MCLFAVKLLKMEWGEDFFHEEFDDDIENWVFYNSETYNSERLRKLRGGGGGGDKGKNSSSNSPNLKPMSQTGPFNPSTVKRSSPLARSNTAPLSGQLSKLSPKNGGSSNIGRLSSSPGGVVPSASQPVSSKPKRPAAPRPPEDDDPDDADSEWCDVRAPSAGLLCPFCKSIFASKTDLKKHVVECMTGGNTTPQRSASLNPSDLPHARPRRSVDNGRAVPKRAGSLPAGSHAAGVGGLAGVTNGTAIGPKGRGVVPGTPSTPDTDLPLDITGLRTQSAIRAAKERQASSGVHAHPNFCIC